MEIGSPKFRSPPAKPPRRRHSEQLTISPTGTYPGSTQRKSYAENRLSLKETPPNLENNSGYESLPADWTTEFSSPHKNTLSQKSIPHSPSTHLRNSQNIPLPINSLCVDSLCVKYKDLSHLENSALKSNLFSSNFEVPNFLSCDSRTVEKGIEIPSNSLNYKLLDFKSNQKDYHRRHHSDPMLSFLKSSNPANGLQKYAIRSHSFLGASVSDQNRLCCSGVKETQCLLEENKSLKEIINKLWQHLCSAQACLEKTNCTTDRIVPFSFSDLLSSLYYSQRNKDNAVESRMKVILEERDAAIQELEDMVQVIARSFEDTIPEEGKCSDKEIKELLKEIEVTCNPVKLLQQQRLLLTYLYRSKELKQDRLIHELKILETEKNHLLGKVECLKEEVKSLKLCSEVWNSENKHWEKNLLNILRQVIQQRDVALLEANGKQSLEVRKCRPTHDNLQTAESALKDHDYLQKYLDPCMNVADTQSPRTGAPMLNHFKESPTDEIGLLKGKILILNKTLQTEIEKRETVEEKCLRLERLVNVLQKKVNGQNVGISV